MKKSLSIFALLLCIFAVSSCQPGRTENGDLLFGLDSSRVGSSSDTVKNLQQPVVNFDTIKVAGSNGNTKFTLKYKE